MVRKEYDLLGRKQYFVIVLFTYSKMNIFLIIFREFRNGNNICYHVKKKKKNRQPLTVFVEILSVVFMAKLHLIFAT